jgi:hypothetical protein
MYLLEPAWTTADMSVQLIQGPAPRRGTARATDTKSAAATHFYKRTHSSGFSHHDASPRQERAHGFLPGPDALVAT